MIKSVFSSQLVTKSLIFRGLVRIWIWIISRSGRCGKGRRTRKQKPTQQRRRRHVSCCHQVSSSPPNVESLFKHDGGYPTSLSADPGFTEEALLHEPSSPSSSPCRGFLQGAGKFQQGTHQTIPSFNPGHKNSSGKLFTSPHLSWFPVIMMQLQTFKFKKHPWT